MRSDAYLSLVLCLGACAMPTVSVDWMEHSALPIGISNNAVASARVGNETRLYSFLGLESGKTWQDVSNRAFALDVARGSWREIQPVPGEQGRLASVAATVQDEVYLFGGYTVAQDGTELSTPEVFRFDPLSESYEIFATMPVPVDDSVALVYRDRYVYLVSGWHDDANVELVQVLDVVKNEWFLATPFPGAPVFGHSGGIIDNQLLICDGVKLTVAAEKRNFSASDSCYLGQISDRDPRAISWRKVASHPGSPLYRSAAAGVSGLGVVFVGGSDNPYNFNGTGYNGVPSTASDIVRYFSFDDRRWYNMEPLLSGSMDHRSLVNGGDRWFVIGGMRRGQQVSSEVASFRLQSSHKSPE